MKQKYFLAFTLIELLVVISIIGILISLSVFGLQGARESSRDARRKIDLETIRSGLEIYKSDCDIYPTSLVGPLVGSGEVSSCAVSNTYIQSVPQDPLYPESSYSYSSDGVTYRICATLEQAPSTPVDTTDCGSCTTACNYKVTNQ